MIDTALRKKTTFNELLDLLETDKTKIKLPARSYLHFFDTQAYQHILDQNRELEQHQTHVHNYNVREHEVRQVAGETGVTANEVRELLKDLKGSPGPSGLPGEQGRDGRDGRDGGRDGRDGGQGPQG